MYDEFRKNLFPHTHTHYEQQSLMLHLNYISWIMLYIDTVFALQSDNKAKNSVDFITVSLKVTALSKLISFYTVVPSTFLFRFVVTISPNRWSSSNFFCDCSEWSKVQAVKTVAYRYLVVVFAVSQYLQWRTVQWCFQKLFISWIWSTYNCCIWYFSKPSLRLLIEPNGVPYIKFQYSEKTT